MSGYYYYEAGDDMVVECGNLCLVFPKTSWDEYKEQHDLSDPELAELIVEARQNRVPPTA